MTRLFLGGLKEGASRTELEREFETFGPLREVWVARKPPGFGFILFENSRDADQALREMDGQNVCGGRIRVEYARDNGQGRGGRGGGGRGGGGGYGGGGGGGGYGGERDWKRGSYNGGGGGGYDDHRGGGGFRRDSGGDGRGYNGDSRGRRSGSNDYERRPPRRRRSPSRSRSRSRDRNGRR